MDFGKVWMDFPTFFEPFRRKNGQPRKYWTSNLKSSKTSSKVMKFTHLGFIVCEILFKANVWVDLEHPLPQFHSRRCRHCGYSPLHLRLAKDLSKMFRWKGTTRPRHFREIWGQNLSGKSPWLVWLVWSDALSATQAMSRRGTTKEVKWQLQNENTKIQT